MSLATRCPACGTVFRVVQDQLKVSGGWVRCGQCHEVFNGLQTLFELPPEPPLVAPPPPKPAPAAPAAGLFVARAVPRPAPANSREPTEPEPIAPDDRPEPEPAIGLADAAPEEAALIGPDPSEQPPAPPPRHWAYRPLLANTDTEASEAETVMPVQEETPEAVSVMPAQDEASNPAGLDHDLGEAAQEADVDDVPVEALLAKMDQMSRRQADNFVISQPLALPATWQTTDAAPTGLHANPLAAVGGATMEAAGQNTPVLVTSAADDPPPGKAARRGRKRQRKPAFMRQAERAARWRSPAVRALLGSTAVVLVMMLMLQIAHQQRDELAARWQDTREPLAAWCKLASCQLQPPRSIASLTLDSSALSRTARPQVLRFEAELRNAADHVVRAPALELSLTDNLGHQLARKVLLPEQMAAPAAGLPPRQTWHIDIPLQVGDLQIAGFTAEVFYP